MRYNFILFFSLLFFSSSISYGQLSIGGFPMEVNTLKSAENKVVYMPALKQSTIDAALVKNTLSENSLKPFKFAHAFEVDLNSSNAGQWYSTSADYNVWKLTVDSENAKSINLIFDNFELSTGARLFIYNENTNHYLGAFSSENNKPSRKFAVAPVLGDQITIQYEVPEKNGTPVDFTISRINHDFVGILNFERRPYYGLSAGDCNIDVNCDLGDKWTEVKNSVVRLIVDGDEMCSGTLINNTAEDMTPYVLSAAHCYDQWDYAETTVYTFNYESPYCAPLDGDPMHSLSGAIMKAQFDSLDFALVEMDEIPPADFRPYFAGWDRSGELPDSSVSIHHPYGDIKKIAFDYDLAAYNTFQSSSIKNPENGSFQILKWDEGVTEIGSSGGALFSMGQNLIGTLSGGLADCKDPIKDSFARFDMQWNYKSDSTKQLKCWLDPILSGNVVLEGKNFNEDENFCKAYTNLIDDDEHALISLSVSAEMKGYWGGSNDVGITEIMERFSIAGNETLDGISFGVGKLDLESINSSSRITVKVYNGDAEPETLIYSGEVSINTFVEDAMNFVAFDETVEPADTFFVGFELSNIEAQDSFAIYQSLRESASAANAYYYKKDGVWNDFSASNTQNYGMVNVMELVACNVDDITDTPIVEIPVNVLIYPNPTSSELVLESDNEIEAESISVFNMIGQKVDVDFLNVEPYRIRLNLNGKTPGVYFIRFAYDDSFVTRKISFIPR